MLAAEPNRDLSDFYRLVSLMPHTYIIPTWSENELEKISVMFPHANDWRTRFEILGRVPRFVLEDVSLDPHVILDCLCDSGVLQANVERGKKGGLIMFGGDIIHTLFHIRSTRSITFASHEAAKVVSRRLGITLEELTEIISNRKRKNGASRRTSKSSVEFWE